MWPRTLDAVLAARLAALGRRGPTAVQARVVQQRLDAPHTDAIVQAPTGSGKTLAYLLPMLQGIDVEVAATQAVVVAPTQDGGRGGAQATQVVQVARGFVQDGRPRIAKVVGRLPSPALRSIYATPAGTPQLVVGTPRALAEHFQAGVLRADRVRGVVVDEVDYCCQPALLPTLLPLLRRGGSTTAGPGPAMWPGACSLVLVSATITPAVRELADRVLRVPVPGPVDRPSAPAVRHADVGAAEAAAGATNGAALPSSIAHALLRAPAAGAARGPSPDVADAALFRRWYAHACRPGAATAVAGVLVFCQSRERLERLQAELRSRGLRCCTLHADSTKEARRHALSRLAMGKVNVLLATEMASRGLDLPRLSHVYNHDLPRTQNEYIHRAGRVGRVRSAPAAADGYVVQPGEVVSVVRSDAEADLVRRWAAPASLVHCIV